MPFSLSRLFCPFLVPFFFLIIFAQRRFCLERLPVMSFFSFLFLQGL